ncbi:hypothetical protein SKAU_G00103820 [Synaphobranchus kaupii]|uniref:Uncharacterized protein n=1 Tax=Synaphobranchus kaupii TaxID=118154 RepID=A0A9Q1J7D5_SYNKA|nr:hypothetical protein SKAU_G00103820 [Synaphobranchus kaupii]
MGIRTNRERRKFLGSENSWLRTASCSSTRNKFVQAGITKMAHLTTAGGWRAAEEIAAITGVRSIHLVQTYLEGV